MRAARKNDHATKVEGRSRSGHENRRTSPRPSTEKAAATASATTITPKSCRTIQVWKPTAASLWLINASGTAASAASAASVTRRCWCT
jgi:hypothetical protein